AERKRNSSIPEVSSQEAGGGSHLLSHRSGPSQLPHRAACHPAHRAQAVLCHPAHRAQAVLCHPAHRAQAVLCHPAHRAQAVSQLLQGWQDQLQPRAPAHALPTGDGGRCPTGWVESCQPHAVPWLYRCK
uniref:Uncharacterized protein n=1 Tax=Ficedula albicollis TaxID=59894 RepID=A0A803VE57_FICAL